MDLRDRVSLLAKAVVDPAGFDMDAWITPDARLSLPSIGLERDLAQTLSEFSVFPLAHCSVDHVRVVRNVVMINWDIGRIGGGGGEGSAVLSFNRAGLVTHARVEGALLAGA